MARRRDTFPGFDRRRMLSAALLPVGLAALASACGSSSTGASSATTAAGGAPRSTQAGGPSGTVVTAEESEYKIALSQTQLSPGTYTFEAENTGTASHDLVIDGPGVSTQKTGLLAPGEKGTVTVTLRQGTYDVYCNVDGHKGLGMDVRVTVS